MKEFLDWLWQQIEDLLGPFYRPLFPLAAGLLGIFLAWLLLHRHFHSVAWVTAISIVVAYLIEQIGVRGCLPRRPTRALFFLECWIIAPAVIAGLASAALILIAIQIAPYDKADENVKELVKALATAGTGFLTSAFISWLADKDDSRLSDRIQRHFQAAYQRGAAGQQATGRIIYFRAGSLGEQAVQSSVAFDGWGLAARRGRAAIIEEEIATGASAP